MGETKSLSNSRPCFGRGLLEKSLTRLFGTSPALAIAPLTRSPPPNRCSPPMSKWDMYLLTVRACVCIQTDLTIADHERGLFVKPPSVLTTTTTMQQQQQQQQIAATRFWQTSNFESIPEDDLVMLWSPPAV